MRASYGLLWKHDSEGALQIWANALAEYDREQIDLALDQMLSRYMNFPPTLPQFLELVREDFVMPANLWDQDQSKVRAAFSYSKPESMHNPSGNPYGIQLPANFARIQENETVSDYSRRITCSVMKRVFPRSGAYGANLPATRDFDF